MAVLNGASRPPGGRGSRRPDRHRRPSHRRRTSPGPDRRRRPGSRRRPRTPRSSAQPASVSPRTVSKPWAASAQKDMAERVRSTGTVEDQRRQAVRMARGIRLGQLRPVALAVESQLLDPEPVADRIRGRRRPDGWRTAPTSRDRRSASAEACLGERRGGGRPGRRARVGRARLGAVATLGRTDAALVEEEDVVAPDEVGIEVVEDPEGLVEPASARPADRDRERARPERRRRDGPRRRPRSWRSSRRRRDRPGRASRRRRASPGDRARTRARAVATRSSTPAAKNRAGGIRRTTARAGASTRGMNTPRARAPAASRQSIASRATPTRTEAISQSPPSMPLTIRSEARRVGVAGRTEPDRRDEPDDRGEDDRRGREPRDRPPVADAQVRPAGPVGGNAGRAPEERQAVEQSGRARPRAADDATLAERLEHRQRVAQPADREDELPGRPRRSGPFARHRTRRRRPGPPRS